MLSFICKKKENKNSYRASEQNGWGEQSKNYSWEEANSGKRENVVFGECRLRRCRLWKEKQREMKLASASDAFRSFQEEEDRKRVPSKFLSNHSRC